MEFKEFLEKQESFQRQERTARQNYDNAYTKERAERKAVRLEWAESEAKRRIEEQKEAMQ